MICWCLFVKQERKPFHGKASVTWSRRKFQQFFWTAFFPSIFKRLHRNSSKKTVALMSCMIKKPLHSHKRTNTFRISTTLVVINTLLFCFTIVALCTPSISFGTYVRSLFCPHSLQRLVHLVDLLVFQERFVLLINVLCLAKTIFSWFLQLT